MLTPSLRLLRVLLVVIMMGAGLGCLFAYVNDGVGSRFVAFVVTGMLALAGVHACEKRIESSELRLAQLEAAWAGSELIVPLRWGRVAFLAFVFTALAALGTLLLRADDGAALPRLAGWGVVFFFTWLLLLTLGVAVRALRAGHALRLDAAGVHIAGCHSIPWSHVHGAAVSTIEMRGQRHTTAQLLVRDQEQFAKRSPMTLLFGPLQNLFSRRYVALNCSTLAVHEKRLESALRVMAKRYAHRFDDSWNERKSLAEALASADLQKNQRVDLAELEAANAAMFSLLKTVTDESDPAFQRAKRRLDAAMAGVDANTKGSFDEIKALNARAGQQVRQAKWLAIFVVAVAVIVIIAKQYPRLGGS